MVTVASIEVRPEVVNAVQGDRVQLLANVHDQQDELLSSAAVTWSSADSTIAAVNPQGVLEARSPGTVQIRATFQGVYGATNVRVLRGPLVEASLSSVAMFSGPGVGAEPSFVAVRNGGAGSLTQLMTAVTHRDGQSSGWLRADLAATTTPTQLTLSATTEGLGAGMYDAEVRLSSPNAPNTATVAVTLSVAGFEVAEVGGSTSPREGGDPEHLSVVLRGRPGGNVTLNVRSSDPGQLSVSPATLPFTPANWNAPQTVAIRAVDDALDDGDRTATVTISVVDGQSHDTFEELADRAVTVVAADNDDAPRPRIIVTESAGGTRVTEGGGLDTIFVALATGPSSNVVVHSGPVDISEVSTVSGAALTFTAGSWSVPQIVVVRGVDDVERDGDSVVRFEFWVVPEVSDDAYDAQFASAMVRNADNEGG